MEIELSWDRRRRDGVRLRPAEPVVVAFYLDPERAPIRTFEDWPGCLPVAGQRMEFRLADDLDRVAGEPMTWTVVLVTRCLDGRQVPGNPDASYGPHVQVLVTPVVGDPARAGER